MGVERERKKNPCSLFDIPRKRGFLCPECEERCWMLCGFCAAVELSFADDKWLVIRVIVVVGCCK